MTKQEIKNELEKLTMDYSLRFFNEKNTMLVNRTKTKFIILYKGRTSIITEVDLIEKLIAGDFKWIEKI